MSIRTVSASPTTSDAGLNAKTLTSSANTTWIRDPQWLALPAVLPTEQKVVGLYAIFETGNFIAIFCNGAFTINWGDGTTENFTSGATAYHEYSYTNAAFDGTLTSKGYKQAIVTITPQAGQNLNTLNLSQKHNQAGLANGYSTGWLDLCVSMPNGSSLTIGVVATNVRNQLLEQVVIKKFGGIALNSTCTNLPALRSVDISGINSVNSMSAMFQACALLTDVAIRDTEAVTNFGSMFNGCASLQTIPLFNTVSATITSNMFASCRKLTSVPLFNTASVTAAINMFTGCFSLTSVPLFNTASATSMASMFTDCRALKTVPLFNTSLVTNMNSMFTGCTAIKTVPLFNTASATSMAGMFNNCSGLKFVPLFNTAAVTNMSTMFQLCNTLTSVPLFNTVSVTNMNNLFNGCSVLASVPLFNTAAVTNMGAMFSSCGALSEVPALVTTAVTVGNFANMFASCNSLIRIQAKNFGFTFSISNLKLSATALNEIYTNLPTVTAQTITVTGNYGTATDNPAIATAKGWTVTG